MGLELEELGSSSSSSTNLLVQYKFDVINKYGANVAHLGRCMRLYVSATRLAHACYMCVQTL
jgi:hypothetical protein